MNLRQINPYPALYLAMKLVGWAEYNALFPRKKLIPNKTQELKNIEDDS